MKNLHDLLLNIKYNSIIDIIDESATKQTIILPLLTYLGWDTKKLSEVYPEYPINGLRIDYLLKINNITIFLEVKKPKEKLENHEEQLLNYSFRKGVELSILTNGLTWWFYLPLQKSDWKDRKFMSIDLRNQELNLVSSNFIQFLSKENLINLKAIELAKQQLEEIKKRQQIQLALHNVWNRLLNDFDSPLIPIIIDDTEKDCGFVPSIKEVKEFIFNSLNKKKHKNNDLQYRYFDGKPSIAHVMEVCYIYYKYKKDYKQAVNIVAHTHNLVSTTIMDQCTRRLGIIATEFRKMLLNRDEMILFLLVKFPNDGFKIKNFLYDV